MKKIFLLFVIVVLVPSLGGCPGKSHNNDKTPYSLRLQYQFTPGIETFSTITGDFSDPAKTTFRGYQYSLSAETNAVENMNWSDLSRVIMTSPASVNSQSSKASCYTGTGIDPFSGKTTRTVDFYCEGSAFLPDAPPSGTYTISAPRSAGTGTQTLIINNVMPQSIDRDLHGVFVPSVKLTTDSNGMITRIDWTWSRKDSTGAWIAALDSEISAAFEAIIFEVGSVNSIETISVDVSSMKSASGSIIPPAQTFTPARFSVFSFDKARYGYVFHWMETTRFSMITPYMNSSDMASINEAFSTVDCVAWGFQHNGIDFFPTADLKQFRSAAPGIVEEVRLQENIYPGCTAGVTCKWQVNVMIRYDATYSLKYVFEPMTASGADGQEQLNKISNYSVAAGKILSQGDIIGELLSAGSGAHVHFGVQKIGREETTAICPEPYFIPEARISILDLIHKDHPTWNMCYSSCLI